MNRRRNARYRFTALAKVRDLLTDSDIGYIADMSTRGMRLLSSKSLTRPGHRRVTITLPASHGAPVTVTGEIRVAWNAPEDDGSCYSTGCQFVNFSTGDKLSLLKGARAYLTAERH